MGYDVLCGVKVNLVQQRREVFGREVMNEVLPEQIFVSDDGGGTSVIHQTLLINIHRRVTRRHACMLPLTRLHTAHSLVCASATLEDLTIFSTCGKICFREREREKPVFTTDHLV